MVKRKSKSVKRSKSRSVSRKVSRPVSSSRKVGLGLAIFALIVNVLLPGVGSLIAGKTKTGLYQLIMFIVSIPLMIFFVGFIIFFAVWIWGIVTGARLVNDAR